MPQVTINANRSVFIDSNSPTTNYDGSPQVDVGEASPGSELRRGLIGFDLSTVPASAKVTSATLKMYDGGSDLTDNTRTMRVYRLKRAWVENQATWNVYSTGNSWGTAGASNTTSDREATESGSISVPNPPNTGYESVTLTAAHIEAMIAGTYSNNGFILVMDTESNDMHRFQGSGDANPPQLVIDYTLGGAAFLYNFV